MTRFARAKGSKASNERREEDATPWQVMRQQLVNQTQSDDLKNTEDLSQIVKHVTDSQLDSANEIWSDFGELSHNSMKNKRGAPTKNKESKRKNILGDLDTPGNQAKTKKKLKKNKSNTETTTDSQINYSKLNDKTENHSRGSKMNNKLSKSRNQDNKKYKTLETNTEIGNVSNKTAFDFTIDNQNGFQNKILDKDHNSNTTKANNKIQKIGMKNSNRSSNSYTIIANGREIRIVRYDGFLVKKDDAQQLKNLRRKLKSQNIPTDKIKAIMKLERRKAEKALAREKNTVCFHCRKFGHNFADCPDIKESEASKSGICFKCGSTEHTHFQCKVSQNQNFRYAVCFVCKEQGHIARQCTLNPQGQYPKGGSCHLCGEVTHLRKDCPKAVEEKTSKALTVNNLKNRLLEEIDEEQIIKKSDKKKKKIVKF